MKNLTSAEAILMLMVASMLDLAGFLIFILGTWFGIDDYGILDIMGAVIIGGWMFMRGYSLNATQPEPQAMGSADINDWQQNSEGVYELKPQSEKPTAPKDAAQKSEAQPQKPTATPKQPAGVKTNLGEAKNALRDPKEFAKRALKTFLWNGAVELIPFIGGIYPGWIIIVYKTLD